MGVAREERHGRVQALDALLPLLPGLAEQWPGQKPDCMPGRSGHCQAEQSPRVVLDTVWATNTTYITKKGPKCQHNKKRP